MGLWDRVRGLFGSKSPEDSGALRRDVPAHQRRVPVRNEWGETATEEAKALGRKGKPRRVTKIRVDVVDLIRAMGRDAFPNEFGAGLRVEGDTITEIVLVPGAMGGDRHAILPLYNLPYDRNIVGTVHSHPSEYPIPSDADLQLFRHFGHTHIIIAKPYTRDSWVAYDQEGDVVRLQVVGR